MWIFRRHRQHISLETLSEHLDGRLDPDQRNRVELHWEACSGCKEEMESLEHTVGLLRQTPTLRPRRVFTLAEAPVPAPLRRVARVPAWAYGAAASVAVMAFLVLLSADLTGSLSQEPAALEVPDAPQIESTLPTSPGQEGAETGLAPEAYTLRAVPTDEPAELKAEPPSSQDRVQRADQPTPSPAPRPTTGIPPPTPGEEEIITREVDEQTSEGPFVPATTPQTGIEAVPDASEEVAAAAAAPETSEPEPLQEEEVAVADLPTPVPLETLEPEVSDQTAAAASAPAPTPAEVEPDQLTTATAQELDAATEAASVSAPEEPTAVVWRVLEVVFGGISVLLLGGILWRLRRFRRNPIS